jgi:hypothetical protein
LSDDVHLIIPDFFSSFSVLDVLDLSTDVVSLVLLLVPSHDVVSTMNVPFAS